MTLIDNLITKKSIFWGTLRLILPVIIILFYFYIMYILYYRLPVKIMNINKKKIEL